MADISNRIEQHVQNVQNASTIGAFFSAELNGLLDALGFTKKSGDDYLLSVCIQRVNEEIQGACNTPAIPQGLKRCAAGLMLAEFLTMKMGMGELDGFKFSFEPVLKQLMEGDTNIEYATTGTLSPEKRLEAFIESLRAGRKRFASYRRLKW